MFTSRRKTTADIRVVWYRSIPFLALVCFGLLFTSYVFERDSVAERQQAAFEKSSAVYFKEVQIKLDEFVGQFESLRRLYKASHPVSRTEFHLFVTPELERIKEIEGLFWVPQIRPDDRHAFEEAPWEQGLGGMKIHTHSGASSVDIAAEGDEGDYYFPVAYAEPAATLGDAVGINMGTVPSRRQVLERARDGGQISLLNYVGHSRGGGTSTGEGPDQVRFATETILIQPVYSGEDRPETLDERRDRILGYLLLQFNLGASLEAAISEIPPEGMDISVLDMGADGGIERVYRHQSRLGGVSQTMPPADPEAISGLKHVMKLSVPDRDWVMLFTPTPAYMELHRGWKAEYSLVGGSVLVGGVLFMLGFLRRRNAIAEGLVRSRTKALLVSDARLSAIFETVADGICLVNDEGHIEQVNPALEEIFGYKADDLTGQKITILLPTIEGGDNEAADSWFRPQRQRMIGETHEATGHRKDGSKFPLELTVGEKVIEGRNLFVGTFRDVTEKKIAEEQNLLEQKMSAMGRLAGGVAHEFNNLLTVISGFARVAMKDPSDRDRVSSSIEEIIAAADQAAGLTRQMLAFGRRQEIRQTNLGMRRLISELISMLRPLVPANIELHTELGEAELYVMADRHQLTQAVMNLSLNACDAMPDGGDLYIELSELAEDSQSGDHVAADNILRIKIRDTGTGIDEETLKQVFEPFFTTKKVGKGTGLGLAMAHSAVESAGGSITVTSKVGVGTEFTIFLPTCEWAVESEDEDAVKDRILGDYSGIDVLVVDDQDAIRLLASSALEDAGFNVEVAADGQLALDLVAARKNPFQVVVTDIAMPNMDGIEMARRLVDSRPDLFFVFISGHSILEDIKGHIGEIKAEFLPKPFDPDYLAELVMDFVDGKAQTADIAPTVAATAAQGNR